MLTERDLAAAGVAKEELLLLARQAPRKKGAPSDRNLNAMLEEDKSSPALKGFLHRMAELKDVRIGLPIESHRKAIGTAVVATKKVFRGAFQPFINEMLRKQAEFNEVLFGWADQVVRSFNRRDEEMTAWRAEVESRLRALEGKAGNKKRKGGQK